MRVRRLGPGEHAVMREVRLRALADAPSAFGSTYEREVAFTDEIWRERLCAEHNAHLVCEASDGRAVGIVAGVLDASNDEMADLFGMWVDRVARRSGAADALVTGVIEWAERAPAVRLRLHVAEGNARAERLYERHGFRRTGVVYVRERDGMNEIEMDRPVS